MDEVIELTLAMRMAKRGLPGGRLLQAVADAKGIGSLQGALCPYGQEMPPVSWGKT